MVAVRWAYTKLGVGIPCNTPAITHDGVVIVKVDYTNLIVAVNSSTGQMVWNTTFNRPLPMDIVLDDGALYAGGFDSLFMQKSVATGATVWSRVVGIEFCSRYVDLTLDQAYPRLYCEVATNGSRHATV